VAASIPAVRRLRRQIVIVADVAVGAGIHLASRGHLVGVLQREPRGAVIKGGRQERNRIVARRAVCNREHRRGRGVLRVVRSLPAAAIIRAQVAHWVAAIGLRDLQ